MKLSTDVRDRQRGQVMVIVALMSVVMIGMVGLAIDGGHLYVERRVQQTGVDAAALAAADKYWAVVQTSPTSNQAGTALAFQAGIFEYSAQANLSQSGWSPDPSTYTAPSDACKSGGATATQAFTQGGHTLTLRAIPVSQATVVAGLCVFNATESAGVGTFFIQVLNGVATNIVAVTASALSGHVLASPTLVVLNSDCNSDWKANGSSLTTIVGSAWDNGNIFDNQSGNNVAVSGSVFDHCDAAVPSPQFSATGGTTGHASILPDPLKSWPNSTFKAACLSGSLNGTGTAGTWTTGSPGTCSLPASATDANRIEAGSGRQNKVVLQPGKYTLATGLTGGGCWFMAPGIYEWDNGATQGAFQMSTHNQVMSNELVPPGTANASTNLYPAVTTGGTAGESPQFSWTDSSQTCNGGWQMRSSACTGSCTGVPAGTYWFRVTSAREDSSMWRESYLSNTVASVQALPATTPNGCIGPIVATGLTKLQFGISNVPGMGNPGDTTQYNIYAAKSTSATCPSDSSFGFVTSANFSGGTSTQTEDQLSGCPYVTTPTTANTGQQSSSNCTLGFVWSTVVDGTKITSGWPASPSAFCDILSASPWSDGSACRPDYQSNSGDTANEDYCRTTTGTISLCAVSPFSTVGSPTTPGGAMFYFPSSTSCIFQTNGAPYIYASLAYRSVVLYAESPGVCGTNGASINGGDKSGGTSLNDAQFIGQVYLPTAPLSVSGGGAPIDGALIVWTLNTVGDAATTLTGRFPFIQISTAGRLITCTNGAVGPGFAAAGNTYCPKP